MTGLQNERVRINTEDGDAKTIFEASISPTRWNPVGTAKFNEETLTNDRSGCVVDKGCPGWDAGSIPIRRT